MSAPKPKIDDAYWFEFSETQVAASLTNRDAAAEKLQSLVQWLWPVYTAAAGITVVFSGKVLTSEQLALVASAGVSLVFVYWAATWVQVPKLMSADPRSPDDLHEAHTQLVQSKHRRLMFALVLSAVAAALVATALTVTAGGKEEPAVVEPAVEPVAPHLAAALVEDDAKTVLAVRGLVGEVEVVDLEVRKSAEGKPLALEKLLPTAEGIVSFNLPVEQGTSAAWLLLRWEDAEGMTLVLSRTVEAKSKEEEEEEEEGEEEKETGTERTTN